MEQVNFLAIAVAALIPMIVGFVYYHPKVMGNYWMTANGFKMESISPPKPVMYAVCLGLSFLLSIFIATNVTGEGQTTAPDGHSYVTFQHGLVHGVANTILFVIPILGTLAIFEMRSLKWFIVNTLYWLIAISIMSGILSAWR